MLQQEYNAPRTDVATPVDWSSGPQTIAIPLRGPQFRIPSCPTFPTQECCQLCRQEPGCRYYSWLGQDPAPYTNQCCLKTSDIGRTPHKGHTSGRVCDKTLAFGIQGGIASVASGQSQVIRGGHLAV